MTSLSETGPSPILALFTVTSASTKIRDLIISFQTHKKKKEKKLAFKKNVDIKGFTQNLGDKMKKERKKRKRRKMKGAKEI